MNKEPNGRAPVERRVIRPGRGWRHIAGPVYEHTNGTRVHMLGFVKLQNGEFFSENKWPECIAAARMIRINSGNRKRGLMAWAMTYNAALTGERSESELKA